MQTQAHIGDGDDYSIYRTYLHWHRHTKNISSRHSMLVACPTHIILYLDRRLLTKTLD